MKQDELMKMASECGLIVTPHIEAFANLVEDNQRKKIKHFLTSTTVSVQSRVYIDKEEISMLKMKHEEIRGAA